MLETSVRRQESPDPEAVPSGLLPFRVLNPTLNPHGPDLRKPVALDSAQVLPHDSIRRSGHDHDVSEDQGLPIAHASDITLTTAFVLGDACWWRRSESSGRPRRGPWSASLAVAAVVSCEHAYALVRRTVRQAGRADWYRSRWTG
jgi:hypothetical protein